MKMKRLWLWQCGKNCATLFLLSSSWIVLNPAKASAANKCQQTSTSDTSIAYVVTSTGGGNNTDIVDWGSGGSNEDRVTQLSRDYSVTFKCTDDSGVNLTNADIDVDLETITTPSSAPANLDLGNTGISHQVSVGQNTSYTDLKENFTATNDSVDIVSSSNSQPGENLSLDSNGEITINLRSTFFLQGNAEEFAAGDYSTQFRITATPTSSGTLGSNTTVISKNVEKECSLQNRSEYTETGSPKPYVTSTSSAGFPEPRARRLEASDSVGFDCNTADVDYSVEMTNLTAPIFSSSSNIDLLQGGGSNGVDHKVRTRKIHPSSSTTTELQALTQELTTGIIDQRTGESTDDNGDIEIEVTSRFETTGAEELGAGDYSATFTVTVTAN